MLRRSACRTGRGSTRANVVKTCAPGPVSDGPMSTLGSPMGARILGRGRTKDGRSEKLDQPCPQGSYFIGSPGFARFWAYRMAVVSTAEPDPGRPTLLDPFTLNLSARKWTLETIQDENEAGASSISSPHGLKSWTYAPFTLRPTRDRYPLEIPRVATPDVNAARLRVLIFHVSLGAR